MRNTASPAPPANGRELNRILLALPSVEYDSLSGDMEATSLEPRQMLYLPSAAITHVYFPQSCVASVLAVDNDGDKVEVITVGREGMVGMALVHGFDSSPNECFIQIVGDGKRMLAEAFTRQLPDLPMLQRLLQRYADALFNSAAQSVVCNRHHSVMQRCARWLLMTDDRVAGKDFALTQEFLSYMLAARRPSVSQAAGSLQTDGLIEYSRGVMRILDRSGLEAASCECYDITRASHDRVFE